MPTTQMYQIYRPQDNHPNENCRLISRSVRPRPRSSMNRRPAGEEVRGHSSLAFHLNFAAMFEGVFVLEPFVGGFGNLNGSKLAERFHAAGSVHGIAPEVVNEFLAADDSSDDGAGADADAELKTFPVARIELGDHFLHVEGHFRHRFHVVWSGHGQAAHHHVCEKWS